MKFADWVRERPKSVDALELGLRPDLAEDERAWMFISCDVNGMVVVNEVTSVAFGMYYSDDRILIDPKKFDNTKYQTISTRFYSPENP